MIPADRAPLPDALRTVRLADDILRGDPLNPRHNEHAIPAIAANIERYGFTAPVIARPDPDRPDGLIVIAGHTRLAAAASAGIEAVPVHVLDVTEAEGRALMLSDNKLGELAEWNDDGLAAILADLDADDTIDTSLLGWTDDELAELIAGDDDLGGGSGGEGGGPRMLQPPAEPASQLGEVYVLGGGVDDYGRPWPVHVIACGDSLDGGIALALAALVEAGGAEAPAADLVFTDPPFAVYGSSTGVSSSVADDSMVVPFFRSLFRQLSGVVPAFGQVYVCCDWRTLPAIQTGAKGCKLDPKNVLVWDKGSSGLGYSWANGYELLAYFVNLPSQRTMKGHDDKGVPPVQAVNVLRHARVTGPARLHNAAKPVDLIREVIAKSAEGRAAAAHECPPVRVVLDAFGGSGSTLIAAAAEGMNCALVELSPGWCDVIRQRWGAYAHEQGIEPGPGALGDFKDHLQASTAGKAISRSALSGPAQLALDNGGIRGRVLDYGSGRGGDVERLREQGATRLRAAAGGAGAVEAYDPNHGPAESPIGPFDTILCTYVLNVVDTATEADILRELFVLLAPGGRALISVRRDLDPEADGGSAHHGQRWVDLAGEGLPIVEENATFCMYLLADPGGALPPEAGAT